MADTRTMWRQRVTGWRASGLTAEAYSAQHGFAASTLRWWSSRLARERAATPSPAAPVVRFAQLVRAAATDGERAPGAIVVELLDARARLTVPPGVDMDALVLLVDVLLGRAVR